MSIKNNNRFFAARGKDGTIRTGRFEEVYDMTQTPNPDDPRAHWPLTRRIPSPEGRGGRRIPGNGIGESATRRLIVITDEDTKDKKRRIIIP